MIRWKNIRRGLFKTVDGFLLMIAGAFLLIQYIEWSQPALGHSLANVERSLSAIFWVSLLIGAYLRPQEQRDRRHSKEPSPRWSGIIVVLFTGFAAAFFVATASNGSNYKLAAAIAFGTLIIATFVWRFATIHATEIGQAQFKRQATDNPGANGN